MLQQSHTCYKVVNGSNDSVNDRISHPDVFCDKVVLKYFVTHKRKYMQWSLI